MSTTPGTPGASAASKGQTSGSLVSRTLSPTAAPRSFTSCGTPCEYDAVVHSVAVPVSTVVCAHTSTVSLSLLVNAIRPTAGPAKPMPLVTGAEATSEPFTLTKQRTVTGLVGDPPSSIAVTGRLRRT